MPQAEQRAVHILQTVQVEGSGRIRFGTAAGNQRSIHCASFSHTSVLLAAVSEAPNWLVLSCALTLAFVDAAVRVALPIAGSLDIYQVGPVRGDGPHLIEAVRELEGTEDWLSTETP